VNKETRRNQDLCTRERRRARPYTEGGMFSPCIMWVQKEEGKKEKKVDPREVPLGPITAQEGGGKPSREKNLSDGQGQRVGRSKGGELTACLPGSWKRTAREELRVRERRGEREELGAHGFQRNSHGKLKNSGPMKWEGTSGL